MNPSTRTLASFILSVAAASLLVLGVAQCLQGCAVLAGGEFDEDQARTELSLLAGDAHAIGAAFEENKPEVAGSLHAFGDALAALSSSEELDATSALVALGSALARESAAGDEELTAYLIVADVLLRRVAAYSK